MKIQVQKPKDPSDITFHVPDGKGGQIEMLRLCEGGDIYVKGKLADNDKAVVDGLRDFLIRSKPGAWQ